MAKRILTLVWLVVVSFALLQCTPNTSPAPSPNRTIEQTPSISTAAPTWKVGKYRVARTKEFEDLMAPIDREIRAYYQAFSSPEDLARADTTQLITTLQHKYHDNLTAVVRAVEKQTGQTLSDQEREILIRLILEDEVTRISNEILQSMLGTPSIEFEATVVPVSPPANQP